MKMRQRFLRALRPVGLFLVMAILMSACGGDGTRTRFYSLGTGGTGGVYYPLGGAIASRLSVRDTLGQYTAEVTGGSVENVNRIISGEMDLGFATANSAYQAFEGVADYATGGSPDLRIVAPLYLNRIHILVGRSVDAVGIEDLRGLTISVGAPGSATEQTTREILGAYGLTYDDISQRYLSFSESAAALRDGAVEAAFLSVGYPAGAVLEATTTGGARLLPVVGPGVERLLELYPYYEVSQIPGGIYPGVDVELPTVAMRNWIMALESLDPSVARAVLDVLSDDRVELEKVHEMAKQIDLSALNGASIPLHSETAAWLRGPGAGDG